MLAHVDEQANFLIYIFFSGKLLSPVLLSMDSEDLQTWI